MDALDRIFIHQIAAPGLPGTGITAPEAAALRTDVAGFETTLAGLRVVDLADVDTTNLADERVLIYDAGSGGFLFGIMENGIPQVTRAGSTVIGTEVGTLDFGVSFNVVLTSPGHISVTPVFGPTGASPNFARQDHTHTLRADAALPLSASGSLSSGSRGLGSGTIAGLDPAVTYIISGELKGEMRGEGTGAGRSHPKITIHGNTRHRFSNAAGYVRTVAGVDREYSMAHPGVSVSGVTSVAVSAGVDHIDGDPKYIGGSELVLHIEANR